MARHGVSPYRATDDRRVKWERDHPREARIQDEASRLGSIIRQWRTQIDWAEGVMARTGRVHNAKSWAQRVERERILAGLERMKGAYELRLKEVQR